MPISQPTSGPRPPRRAVTGRAIVLATVVVLLIVLLASPLNRYFASRHDLSSAATQLHDDNARLTQLKAEQKQWGDPGYIQAQARARLQYAMPGDTTYVVVDHGAANEIDKTATVKAKGGSDTTWNSELWNSVQRASGT
jgi:cell division protein FtsB